MPGKNCKSYSKSEVLQDAFICNPVKCGRHFESLSFELAFKPTNIKHIFIGDSDSRLKKKEYDYIFPNSIEIRAYMEGDNTILVIYEHLIHE